MNKGIVNPKDFFIRIGDISPISWFTDCMSVKEDKVISLDESVSTIDILVLCEIYTSKSQAFKDGWGIDRPFVLKSKKCRAGISIQEKGNQIPFGFSDFCIGKGKAVRISILKESKEDLLSFLVEEKEFLDNPPKEIFRQQCQGFVKDIDHYIDILYDGNTTGT